jgi:hypothetical protein
MKCIGTIRRKARLNLQIAELQALRPQVMRFPLSC